MARLKAIEERTLVVRRVAIRSVFGWRPKVDRTLVDVDEGRLSFSASFPVVASRLDTPRGAFYIIDGYHRVVEAVLRGDRGIDVVIDPNIPRIERTGGAHAAFVNDKVNVYDYVSAGL